MFFVKRHQTIKHYHLTEVLTTRNMKNITKYLHWVNVFLVKTEQTVCVWWDCWWVKNISLYLQQKDEIRILGGVEDLWGQFQMYFYSISWTEARCSIYYNGGMLLYCENEIQYKSHSLLCDLHLMSCKIYYKNLDYRKYGMKPKALTYSIFNITINGRYKLYLLRVFKTVSKLNFFSKGCECLTSLPLWYTSPLK